MPPMDRSSPGTPRLSSTLWRSTKNEGREEKQRKQPPLSSSSVLQLCPPCSDSPTLPYKSPKPGCCFFCLLSILFLLFAGCQQVNKRLGSRARNNYSWHRLSGHQLRTPLPSLGHVFLMKRWAEGMIRVSDRVMSTGCTTFGLRRPLETQRPSIASEPKCHGRIPLFFLC